MTKITQKFLKEKLEELVRTKDSFLDSQDDPCTKSMANLLLTGKISLIKELLEYMKKKPTGSQKTLAVELQREGA